MVDAIKILVDQLDLPDDVIGIIHEHLQGYYQYRRCARELLMPHFRRSLASINKQTPDWYRRALDRTDVHPGRYLVRIIRPRFSGFSSSKMSSFKGERVNIHGLSKSRGAYNNKLDCIHDDLDTVLTMLGCKRFKSKKKISLLVKAA